MKQIYLINQLPHIRGLCLKSKGIVLSLLMLFTILFSSEKVNAQSGTVTFTAADYTSLSAVLHDGNYSSTDISGIQLNIFGATSTINAANRTSSSTIFQYITSSSLGAGYAYGAIFSPDYDNIIVIASNDGSEFSFKSIYVNDAGSGSSITRFEGFKDGVSTGYVDFGPTSNLTTYDDLLISTNLPTSKFGNVDEIRITNQYDGNMTNGVWIGINAITIGAAVLPAPTVSGISPTNGPVAGGTSVSITGTNFTGATSVKFNGTNATGFTINSATSITATSPAGSGTADVTVTTPSGTSATSAADQFTYVAAPTITSISPTNGLTTGGTSVTITGTNLTNATAVKFGSSNATGFSVSSETSITATSPAGSGTADITVTTIGGTSATSAADQFIYLTAGTWTGLASTSHWTDAGNWSDNQVPTATSNVTIPSSPIGGYLPMIFPGDAIDCNNLTSDNGALEISSSSLGTGSLIVHGTVSGKLWTDIYLTENQWHIVAPSVDGSDISSFISSGYGISSKVNGAITTYAIADYNENGNAWNAYFTNNTSGSFALGKGYSMRLDNPSSVSFYGDIEIGTKTISLTKAGEGWNCIGNPYTSAIGITSDATSSTNFLKANAIDIQNIDPAYACLYLWDEATLSYKIISNTGFSTTKTVLAQDYIAPGQGFFVKAYTGSSTVSFTPAMQSHQNNAAAPLLKSAKASWPTIQLNIANGKTTASTIVAFNSEMTKGLDPTYDAGLLRGTTGVNLYSRLVEDNGIDFAIQALPSAEESVVIPIGVESKEGGNVTFSAKTVELPANTSVVIEDKTTGTLTSLADSGVYTATVEAGVKGIGRFYLITKSATTTTNIKADEAVTISAYASYKTIYINGKLAGATAQLFDINGKQVDTKKLTADNASTLEESKLVNGVYVLRVISVGKVYSFKVVLQ